MVTNEMCAILGKAHEFFLALKKAGFSDELIQEVINSKDNVMAKKMLVAISVETVIESKNENVQEIKPLFSAGSSIFTVLPTTAKFVAEDKFVVNTDKKAKVKISYVGDNFINWFLKKTEEPFPGGAVYGRKLNQNSVDGPILAELGGEEKAETTLTEIYAMMLTQPNGENGKLLNIGNANIFYVRDINNTLRAVGVDWSGGGWGVCAYSVEDSCVWGADYCVFSRNSLVVKTI